MLPADAEAYWLAPKTRSDQFLLFAFDAVDAWDGDRVRTGLLARARCIPDLNLVVRETVRNLDFPYWEPSSARPDQFVERPLTVSTWRSCLDDVASLIGHQVDPRQAAWRVHLYPSVTDLPDGSDRGSVAVLQVSHALADGRGSTELARRLFGAEPVGDPAVSSWGSVASFRSVLGAFRFPIQLGRTIVRGLQAYRLRADDSTTPLPVLPGPMNRSPGDDRQLLVIVTDADRLRIGTHSVTVGAIIRIADAIADAGLDADDGRVVVELTFARRGMEQARNDFFTAGVDSHREIADRHRRADAVAAEIEAARRRDESPGRVAARRASHATPAPLMYMGTTLFDPAARSPTVTGHTVVSSVNRGAATLQLAGGKVRFTTGFPAISAMQGVTHGVHGIGSAVAISATTSRDVLPDFCTYGAALRAAFGAGSPDRLGPGATGL